MAPMNAATAATIRARLHDGTLLPYLGPGLLQLTGAQVPDSPSSLADALGARVRLPSRARGNCWAAAQFIENRRFRATLDHLMGDIFPDEISPSPLHALIASLASPLVVDTWYDCTMRRALAGRTDWGELQGAGRITPGEDRWVRAYDPAATATSPEAVATQRTVLYKPHGGVMPARQFLLTDADYVEVLTEIDIQTPIPEVVRQRRAGCGFLFLGCRFNEQTLRIFARGILKRSGGSHVAIFDDLAALTPNEARFLDGIGIEAVECRLSDVADAVA